MARKAFYSFEYKPDNWRASQVRNMGVVEGNQAVADNDWESVTKGGDAAIERWIAEQMAERSCVVVLIGATTAGRKWIDYEIKKAWADKRGVLGVHIHGLKDRNQNQTTRGANPFDTLAIGGTTLSRIVRVYDPPYAASTSVYDYINSGLAGWVEEAVRIRSQYA